MNPHCCDLCAVESEHARERHLSSSPPDLGNTHSDTSAPPGKPREAVLITLIPLLSHFLIHFLPLIDLIKR